MSLAGHHAGHHLADSLWHADLPLNRGIEHDKLSIQWRRRWSSYLVALRNFEVW